MTCYDESYPFVHSHYLYNWLSSMGWSGARTGNDSAQAYYTSPDLARAVSHIAKRYPGPYVELGVGGGALYDRLPEPKCGVELRRCLPRLSNVVYGKDALKWKPENRFNTVVMNPPFAKQVAFFNHAAGFANVIVWIAGLNIRLWTNEDMLDPSMHLIKEWLVPPEWSTFSTAYNTVHIRPVVQVWRRRLQPRPLWNLRSTLEPCKDQLHPPAGAVIVKRVGAPKDVGDAIAFSRCKIYQSGKNVTRTSHGTLVNRKLGTSVALAGVPSTLRRRYDSGVINDLLSTRTSSKSLCVLSTAVLSSIASPAWRRLIRPIEYLDGRRRHHRQW